MNVSHGFALGDLDADRSRRLVDELAEAGISWTTVAPRPIVRPSSTR